MEKQKTYRLVAEVPEAAKEQIKELAWQISKERREPFPEAALIREAVIQYAEKHGITLDMEGLRPLGQQSHKS